MICKFFIYIYVSKEYNPLVFLCDTILGYFIDLDITRIKLIKGRLIMLMFFSV